jgi:hypothetical protein
LSEIRNFQGQAGASPAFLCLEFGKFPQVLSVVGEKGQKLAKNNFKKSEKGCFSLYSTIADGKK